MVLYLVKNACDDDLAFADGWYDFAYPFGPSCVILYPGMHGDPTTVDHEVEHELLHSFGATDEYKETEQYCSCGARGYLHVANSNCENCTTSPVPCVMRTSSRQICVVSRAQMGWRDSDAYPMGPCDPIDHPASGNLMHVGGVGEELYPGDYVDIYTEALDWVKRIAVTANNSAMGEMIWDGINYAGYSAYVPQRFICCKNSGGSDYYADLVPDRFPPVLSDVTVSDGGGALTKNLSFRFTDDDTYSGMVRAELLEVEAPARWVILDRYYADTYGRPAITAPIYLPAAGDFTLRLTVWDVGGRHKAIQELPIAAGSSVEERANVDGWVSEATPNPTTGVVAIQRGRRESTDVTVSVYSVDGRVVREWVESNQTIVWDGLDWRGRPVPSGKYCLVVRDRERLARRSVMMVH